jgi:sugar phosphate isomerase/epimerase
MTKVVGWMDSIDYSGWVTVECPGPHDEPVAVAGAAREMARRALGLG